MKKVDLLYEGKAKKVYTTEDPDVLIVDSYPVFLNLPENCQQTDISFHNHGYSCELQWYVPHLLYAYTVGLLFLNRYVW